MAHDGTVLAGGLPSQPAAGKLEYYISLDDSLQGQCGYSKGTTCGHQVQGQCACPL
ncbi:MAG: hypothetical protein MZV63_29910 [Marinilabiliales bacterium]|nr:hypothetical protein [Marinilabiliales bacterium]